MKKCKHKNKFKIVGFSTVRMECKDCHKLLKGTSLQLLAMENK